MRSDCFQVKQCARPATVDMNQVGCECSLEIVYLLPKPYYLIQVVVNEHRQKRKPVYSNSLIILLCRQIAGIPSGDYDEFVASVSKGTDQLGGKYFGPTNARPKQF